MRFSTATISRRAFVIGCGGIVLAPTLNAAELDNFAVGVVPADVSSISPYFAEAAGAFTKYGIKADLVAIEGGSRGMQVLLSGNLQAMQGGLSIVINANREGADLRMVSSCANVHTFEVYVVPSIKSPADIKGKKFAISTFTSESDMAATLALRHWGMTRDDVQITPIGGTPQRIAAQSSGQAEVSVYGSPGTAIARERGLIRLLDLSNEGAPWVFNGLVLQREFIEANPDLVKRFLKANIEGVYKALSDEVWAKGVISQYLKNDAEVIVNEAYQGFKRTYPRDLALDPKAVSNVIAEVDAIGPSLEIKDPTAYVDMSVIDSLKAEGFVDEMKKQYGL